MSLGLFTVDVQNHLWFDMDRHLTDPTSFFPKHFVLNHRQPNNRILILHTGWLIHAHNAAIGLANSNQPVSGKDAVNCMQAAIDLFPPNEPAFARVVFQEVDDWWYHALDNQSTSSGPKPVKKEDLYCVGVGDAAAQSSWLASSHLLPEVRLRKSMEAASIQRADVIVPVTRQPARIDLCVKPWAYPSELLT